MPAVRGARVTGMLCGFVGNLDALGAELLAQAALDEERTFAHGNTLRNGFTVTLTNTPAAT